MRVISLLLFLTGCSAYPGVSYDEMDVAIANAKTEKERKFYEKKLELFERDAERADEFYRAQAWCEAGKGLRGGGESMWVCKSQQRDLRRRPFKDLDDKVKTYRRERTDCGCANKEQMLREIRR